MPLPLLEDFYIPGASNSTEKGTILGECLGSIFAWWNRLFSDFSISSMNSCSHSLAIHLDFEPKAAPGRRNRDAVCV